MPILKVSYYHKIIQSKMQTILPQINIKIGLTTNAEAVYDQFNKPFRLLLGQNVVYKLIGNIIEETEYCSCVMKSHFNKELATTKENNEKFERKMLQLR